MQKIIIHIDDDTAAETALDGVKKVIQQGKTSETAGRQHYCHFTRISLGKGNGSLSVQAGSPSVNTHTFKVWTVKER